ncbi:MAG: hemerythrin family protein [Bacteroidales bacterium]|nr:hemerythrin family protein [Bacteroidales bacterium]
MERRQILQWDPIFNVNIKNVDRDHQKLLCTYNQLVEVYNEKGSFSKFSELLSELTDYSLNHFKMEEELAKDIPNLNFKEHKIDHQRFIYEVAVFNSEFERGNYHQMLKIIDFLYEWWSTHVMLFDQQLNINNK